MISVKRGERVITRNSSFFKPVPFNRRFSHEADPDDVVIEIDRGQQAYTTDDPAVPVQLSESQPSALVVTPKWGPRNSCMKKP